MNDHSHHYHETNSKRGNHDKSLRTRPSSLFVATVGAGDCHKLVFPARSRAQKTALRARSSNDECTGSSYMPIGIVHENTSRFFLL